MKGKRKNLLVLGGMAAVLAVTLVMVVIFSNNQKSISNSSQANLLAGGGSVFFEVSVNDYPDHQNYDLSENVKNAYVNVYNIEVDNDGYTTTYKETLGTGNDAVVEVEVALGEIVNFEGFLTKAEALASTNLTIDTVPYKNFGGADQLCQINYYEKNEYLENSSDYACATSLSTPYYDTKSVVFEVSVNDYPDHQNYDLSENVKNAYVNVYSIGVGNNSYTTTYKETVGTGNDTVAEIEVGLGEIVNFKGFLTEEEALASTNSSIGTVPYKNFGNTDQLCQINYYEEDEYLENSADYACTNALSTPYSNADIEVFVDDYWWNYLSEDELTYEKCLEVKALWDQGDWTDNYGSTYAPSICKNKFFNDDWYYAAPDPVDNYDPEDDSEGNHWWNNIDGNDLTYNQCYEIKKMWDGGNWTDNYGNSYAPETCSILYADAWNWEWTNAQNNIPPAGYEDEVYSVYTENPFPDTDITTLEGTAAAYLYNIGVLGGFPDGEFKGDREVNRAEAAKFLLLARYGLVQDVANNGQFSDVPNNEWYTKFVVTAANLGIITGYSDGTFRPGNTVNTAEFLRMLTLTFDLPLWLSHNYDDVPADAWYAQYAGVANHYYLFPDRDWSLLPGALLTREEVAVAIYQFLAYN